MTKQIEIEDSRMVDTVFGLRDLLDAWVGNTELSQRIAAEPQGISSNINIIRK